MSLSPPLPEAAEAGTGGEADASLGASRRHAGRRSEPRQGCLGLYTTRSARVAGKCSGERQVDAAKRGERATKQTTQTAPRAAPSLWSRSQLLLLASARTPSDLQGSARVRSDAESQALSQTPSTAQSPRRLRVYESLFILQILCGTSVAFERLQKVHREGRKSGAKVLEQNPTLCGPLPNRLFTVLRRRQS